MKEKEAFLMHTDAKEKSFTDRESPKRQRRVKRLKKAIVLFILSAIFIPTCLCIVLAFKLSSAYRELEALREEIAIIGTDAGNRIESDKQKTEEKHQSTASLEDEQGADGKEKDELIRKVYLTFDDGPSIYTEEILEILSDYDVKATFFVIGYEEEDFQPLYEKIVENGHSIGMHSYSHRYGEIYASLTDFKEDTEKIRSLILDYTGVECSLYRFPGGSSNSLAKGHIQDFISYLNEEGITHYDWNVSAQDAIGLTLTREELIRNCTQDLEKYNSAYILMHDTSSKHSTVEALPGIIEKIQAMENTEIVPITEASVPVQQIKKQ